MSAAVAEPPAAKITPADVIGTGPIDSYSPAWIGDCLGIPIGVVNHAVAQGKLRTRASGTSLTVNGESVLAWIQRERVACTVSDDAARVVMRRRTYKPPAPPPKSGNALRVREPPPAARRLPFSCDRTEASRGAATSTGWPCCWATPIAASAASGSPRSRDACPTSSRSSTS